MDENILLKIEKLITDKNFLNLNDIYDRTTFFDILGISRNENRHSKFLEWLLNPKGTHNLGTEPIKYFLRYILRESIKKREVFEESVVVGLLNNSSKIEIVIKESQTEKTIFNGSRLDIYIEGYINLRESDRNETKQKFILVFENKIDSIESENQTKKYEKEILDIINTREEKIIPIMIFLVVGESVKAQSKQFINITFQSLIDNVIFPLYKYVEDPIIKHYLKEYLNTLEKSLASEITGGRLVMAIRPDTKNILKELYEEHKELFDSVFKENYSKEKLERFNEIKAEEESTRDNTKYKFLNETNIPKNRLIYMIVKEINQKYPDYTIDDIKGVFKEVNRAENKFITTNFIDTEKDQENRRSRFFNREDEILTDKNGVKFTVSNQWGMDDEFKKILKIASSMGYEIKAIES